MHIRDCELASECDDEDVASQIRTKCSTPQKQLKMADSSDPSRNGKAHSLRVDDFCTEWSVISPIMHVMWSLKILNGNSESEVPCSVHTEYQSVGGEVRLDSK